MQHNREKLRNAILYFAKNGGWDVGKKKLAKLLYFTDFTLFELRGKSLTEIDYTKKDFGPMPEPTIFYKELAAFVKDGDIDVEKPNAIGLEKIIAKKEANLKLFDDKEKEVLIQTADKYRLENAGNLEKIAQSEPPYKMVNYGEIIPYHLAFYRNSFGAMDLNDD